jgi:integrase/recombinase XerD
LEDTGQVFENPAARLVIPPRRPKLVRAPTEQQVLSLLQAPDISTPTGLRDRAWLELAYATGARRLEMVQLGVHDLDLDQRMVRLRGKGDKERLVPVGQEACNWLRRYLIEARPTLLRGHNSTALWVSSRTGAALGYAAVQRQLRTLTRRVGVPTAMLTAHALRRACASHLLHHGASPLMLKELLGHERTATLNHYLRLSIGEVKTTHAHTAPGR